ncbi:uncharacterized protein [Rutidosis leptorrhynchoides]|uniref:uncharacterized protein n=1 Tax=Rutidosis leptorrhynchoides TaxID=125765 RepID=UPI003A99F710
MGRRSYYLKDDEGWFYKVRNSRNDLRPILNPYYKHSGAKVEKSQSSTFFVTNLPEGMDRRRLWFVCQSYGSITDSHVAFKHSKQGKRFGFIRFNDVKDEKNFARLLSTIKVDNMSLFATVARFNKESNPNPCNPRSEGSKTKTNAASKSFSGGSGDSSNPKGKNSFANTVKGINPNTKVALKVNLIDQDLLQIDNPMESVLIKLKDVVTMGSIHTILIEEGFEDVSVRHIGGAWLWCTFPNVDACMAFKINDMMETLYSTIKPISKNFVVEERMAWVEFYGMPLCAWKETAYKKVAATVSRFMFCDHVKGTDIGMARVCIATKSSRLIDEDVSVIIDGVEFRVSLRKVGSWRVKLEEDGGDNSDEETPSVPSTFDEEGKKDKIDEEDVPRLTICYFAKGILGHVRTVRH